MTNVGNLKELVAIAYRKLKCMKGTEIKIIEGLSRN